MTVYACFEFNKVDAPILKCIKTFASALKWRDENYSERFLVGYTVDCDPVTMPPEWSGEDGKANPV